MSALVKRLRYRILGTRAVPRVLLALVVLAAAGYFLVPRWFPSGGSGQLTALGTLEATEVTISSEVSARILAIPVEEGQAVHAGDLLVQLDDATTRLAYQRASTVDQDSLALQLAKYQLRAPRDGVILRRDAEPGEVAIPGATLLTLGDLSALDLTVYVAQNDLGRVHLGRRVLVVPEAAPDLSFNGQVQRIADQAEFTPRNTQTTKDRLDLVFAVKVHVPNVGDRLKSGMTATAWFEE
jgi:multidrug resistance efflux pump